MNVLLAMQDAVAQGVLWGIMTLGVYITYKVLDFPDMSVDGTFTLGACVSAVLIVRGVNPFFALLIATLAGMAGGLITGFLHTRLKIPGLLAGILTMLALYSINMRIMGKANTSLLGEGTLLAVMEKYFPISRNVLNLLIGVVFCLVLVVLLYCFFGTEIGCALRATGDNEHMARALGANTDNMKLLGLLLANGFVGLSGAVISQSQHFADVGMGTGTLVIGLASIIIGEVVFRFMRRSFMLKLLAVILGSIVYRVIIAVVLQLGLNANDLKLFSAVLVAVALSVPLLQKKINAAKRGKEATDAET